MKWMIIDSDEEFIKRLKEKVCYNVELDYISSSKDINVQELSVYDRILVSNKIKNKELRELSNVILLSEKPLEINKNENANINKNMCSLQNIYKYQSIEKILRQVEVGMLIKDDNSVEYNDKNTSKNKDNKCKVILFYFCTSEKSKEKIMQRIFGKVDRNKKILYLNLETISIMDDYIKFNKKCASIINAFYCDDYKKIIYEYTKNIHMFYPSDNAFEMINVDFIKIKELIEKIKNDGYDYIFLDVDNKFDIRLLEYFKIADSIITLTNDTETKYNRILKTINSMSSNQNYEQYKDIVKKIKKIKLEEKNEKIYERIKEQIESC